MRVTELFENEDAESRKVPYEIIIHAQRFEADHEIAIDDMFDGDEEIAKELHDRLHVDGIRRDAYLSQGDLNALKEKFEENKLECDLKLSVKDSVSLLDGFIFMTMESIKMIPQHIWDGDDSYYAEEIWIEGLAKEVIDDRKGMRNTFQIHVFPTEKKLDFIPPSRRPG